MTKNKSKLKKCKVLKFIVEDVRSGSQVNPGFFSDTTIPIKEIFFKAPTIPTISIGSEKPKVGYIGYCSGYSYSGSVNRIFTPEVYLLPDGRYKMILKENEDFRKAITGLAYFIQFGGVELEEWMLGQEVFSADSYSPKGNFRAELKYSSPDIEKRVGEI